MEKLQKVSKQSLINKEQFNVIATNNNSSPSQKTEALKKLLTVNGDDDDEKNESESYDHYKIIGDECVASGEVNAKFDKNALDTFLQSFMNIECAQVTTKWKTKRSYKIIEQMKRTFLFKTKLNGITVENDGQSARYSSGSLMSRRKLESLSAYFMLRRMLHAILVK